MPISSIVMQHAAEITWESAEFSCQGFIHHGLTEADPRNHAGAETMVTVSVVVNLEGIAALLAVAPPHAPVGAGILAVENGAQGRILCSGVVEADVEPTLPAQQNDALGCQQIPVQLVTHAVLHRHGALVVDRVAGGAGSA
ncbi:MAG: hypothetical protein ERJ68_04290 [Aphanocapsa feldmannii 277cI]|uniref:Uncharacterized protein n=1 Tax=Aphanocapsa feldmannii 277cI TaxID=2507554 RepID=A0A524RTV1_9CHRO|nr:MAG: hypothetical protein ERJ68_04290 [Aphanocapsa feldmannii 277cI]